MTKITEKSELVGYMAWMTQHRITLRLSFRSTSSTIFKRHFTYVHLRYDENIAH